MGPHRLPDAYRAAVLAAALVALHRRSNALDAALQLARTQFPDLLAAPSEWHSERSCSLSPAAWRMLGAGPLAGGPGGCGYLTNLPNESLHRWLSTARQAGHCTHPYIIICIAATFNSAPGA